VNQPGLWLRPLGFCSSLLDHPRLITPPLLFFLCAVSDLIGVITENVFYLIPSLAGILLLRASFSKSLLFFLFPFFKEPSIVGILTQQYAPHLFPLLIFFFFFFPLTPFSFVIHEGPTFPHPPPLVVVVTDPELKPSLLTSQLDSPAGSYCCVIVQPNLTLLFR